MYNLPCTSFFSNILPNTTHNKKSICILKLHEIKQNEMI